MVPSPSSPSRSPTDAPAGRALADARATYHEQAAASLAVASSVHELGRARGDLVLCARAEALQAAISVHRGDVRGALGLILEAERDAEAGGDLVAAAEVAAIRGQVGYLAGGIAEALGASERAIALADETGDLRLRIYVRRATCLVFGNVGVRDLETRIRTLLALTEQAGDPWEEAISRNDLACYLQETDLAAAEVEIERARSCAEEVRTANRFARGVVLSTRADIRLAARRPQDALDDASAAITLLTTDPEPNPYVLAATVRAEVQARLALGQLEHARESGEGVLRWLGDRLPQIRSLILTTLAQELRACGLVEEAYDALARSAALERQAVQELAELRLGLERANLERTAARRESETLAAKNRELARTHDTLAQRTAELERLQAQLREQADRDWLTGLHNRRYLARALAGSTPTPALPLTLAVLDLDHFKTVNDRFGHAVGDEVLVRTARLLVDALREDDIVVRSGGEEFLVLMPGTDRRAGAAGCERIRSAIETEPWSQVATGLSLTASLGLAVVDAPDGFAAAMHVADDHLYAAKRAGRNRVVGAGDPEPVTSPAG